MNLNVHERSLLRHIFDLRIKELESVQNYWTGKTPRQVIDRALHELKETKSLQQVILGGDNAPST